MSNARAQYKLPGNCRSIIDIGDFYYFGPYLAGRDMKPVAFDRSLPNEALTGVNINNNMVLSGNGVCVGMASTVNAYSVNSFQSFFRDGANSSVFVSQLGLTKDKRYVISAGNVLSEIRDNNVLDFKTKIDLDNTLSTYANSCFILDENIDSFYVVFYSNYTAGAGVYATNRLAILRVNKATFVSTILTSTSTSSSAYSSNTIGTSNYNKSFKHLGKMADGRHLFITYRTRAQTNAPHNMWYMVLDPTTDAISYSSVNSAEGLTGISSFAVPTSIVPVEGRMGDFYMAVQEGDDLVKIARRKVPAQFSGTIPRVPTAADTADFTYCTLQNMPQGLVLPTPGTSVADLAGNFGQISSWVVEDEGKNYLIYFTHNGGSSDNEQSSATPVTRSMLFVFEIDGSTLTYRGHHANAFGYGQQLTGLCFNADKKTVIVCNTSGFAILSWSTDQQNYAASPWRAVAGTHRVFFDTNSQIWIENQNGEVFIFNPDLSSSVVVGFEDNTSSILYSGTTVGINAVINVYNFVGNRMSRTVRLQAKNCTFTDGSRTKDIETLANADTIERVFINGDGNVTVDAFLI